MGIDCPLRLFLSLEGPHLPLATRGPKIHLPTVTSRANLHALVLSAFCHIVSLSLSRHVTNPQHGCFLGTDDSVKLAFLKGKKRIYPGSSSGQSDGFLIRNFRFGTFCKSSYYTRHQLFSRASHFTSWYEVVGDRKNFGSKCAVHFQCLDEAGLCRVVGEYQAPLSPLTSLLSRPRNDQLLPRQHLSPQENVEDIIHYGGYSSLSLSTRS